jgi:uncharacterized protein
LQDPLAELVKLDPRSIGVGQYQHDVDQNLLKHSLSDVVESCVNQVGVDLNTASAALLAYVAGIGRKVARKIVEHRDAHGTFRSRAALLEVNGVGPKTFEQGAGFLRVRGGDNALDASAVHPERYGLVESIAAELGSTVAELLRDPARLDGVDLGRYAQGDVGEFTLRDIVAELKKPGRDPRDEFTGPVFREDLHELKDVEEGMVLDGVVSNVTDFGVFVDVGVHNDGLVHVSELSHKFVQDPAAVVRVGDKVKVKVLAVDLGRRRLSLSIKQATPAPAGVDAPAPPRRERPPKSERRERAREGDAERAGGGERGERERDRVAAAQGDGGAGGTGEGAAAQGSQRPARPRGPDKARDKGRDRPPPAPERGGGKDSRGRKHAPFNTIDLSAWLAQHKR